MVLYEYFHKMNIDNWINTLYRSAKETIHTMYRVFHKNLLFYK